MSLLQRNATFLLLAGALALPSLSAARPALQTPSAPELQAAIAQPVSAIERRVLAPNIAEYFFKVRVGSGPYDEIGVHRVVKESAPNRPVHARNAVFLTHGDIWNFWGIDFRWTLVPATVTDLTFMKTWGLEQDARDLGVAIGIARITRGLTGSGLGKIDLLGWSHGGETGYAYLDYETQLPSILRQVKGFIPVDIYVKTNVPQLQSFACQREANSEASIAAGTYANNSGGLIQALGIFAATDPNGSSILNGPPFNLPGYNNRQAGLLVGEATYLFLAGLAPAPSYHFTGGTFDAQGKPSGLLYSPEASLFGLEQGSAPFQPNQQLADADAAICGTTPVDFDDHLAQITVPILYMGAGGGFGELGIYTTTLLGSTDVTIHVVHKVPADQRAIDWGHADMFLGNDAQTLVWQPILDWVRSH
jgi:hypothetical protein